MTNGPRENPKVTKVGFDKRADARYQRGTSGKRGCSKDPAESTRDGSRETVTTRLLIFLLLAILLAGRLRSNALMAMLDPLPAGSQGRLRAWGICLRIPKRETTSSVQFGVIPSPENQQVS